MVKETIAALALGLAAAPGLAQERTVFYDTERTEFRFKWAPAPGPVTGYEVCLDYGWTRACYGTLESEYTVIPLEWHTWRVQVRGHDEGYRCGEWSEWSNFFNVNPNPADVNFDGGVGTADHAIISSEWGKAAKR